MNRILIAQALFLVLLFLQTPLWIAFKIRILIRMGNALISEHKKKTHTHTRVWRGRQFDELLQNTERITIFRNNNRY